MNRRLDARSGAGRAGRGAAARGTIFVAALRRSSSSSPTSTSAARRASPESIGLSGIVAALAKILRLDVADVQKAVAADAEIDERGLDARLQVDDFALVDVADVIVLAGALDVELFQRSIFNDRDPAFFRLRDVDQHFLLHSGWLSVFDGGPWARK